MGPCMSPYIRWGIFRNFLTLLDFSVVNKSRHKLVIRRHRYFQSPDESSADWRANEEAVAEIDPRGIGNAPRIRHKLENTRLLVGLGGRSRTPTAMEIAFALAKFESSALGQQRRT